MAGKCQKGKAAQEMFGAPSRSPAGRGADVARGENADATAAAASVSVDPSRAVLTPAAGVVFCRRLGILGLTAGSCPLVAVG